MKLFPPRLEIADNEGFKRDLFGLGDFGKGIANLLGHIEDPLVVALNGQWGAGKTVFLKQLAGELRNRGHAVIYFDAFENDYVEDAFAALAREVIELAEESQPAHQKVGDVIKESAVGLAKVLGIAGARAITNFIVTNVTAGLATNTNVETLLLEIAHSAEDSTENYIQKQLEAPKKQKEAIAKFRKALSELASKLSPPKGGEPQKPLIFIIDELDRCKPTYALEILERVKHFLSVPNVHFLLGVNLEQLRCSVEGAYGANTDSNAYLQKFFSLTIDLNDTYQGTHDYKISRYTSHLGQLMGISNNRSSDVRRAFDFINRISLKNDYSLRAVEKIMLSAQLSFSFTNEKQPRPGYIIGGLCILKIMRPQLFLRAKVAKLDYAEIAHIFDFHSGVIDRPLTEHEEARVWWKYFTHVELESETDYVALRLGEYGIMEHDWWRRKSNFRYLVNEVVDRLSPFDGAER